MNLIIENNYNENLCFLYDRVIIEMQILMLPGYVCPPIYVDGPAPYAAGAERTYKNGKQCQNMSYCSNV